VARANTSFYGRTKTWAAPADWPGFYLRTTTRLFAGQAGGGGGKKFRKIIRGVREVMGRDGISGFTDSPEARRVDISLAKQLAGIEQKKCSIQPHGSDVSALDEQTRTARL